MDNKKYEYVMELPEIREFCRVAYLEQFKQRKRKWIVFPLIIAAEAFLFPEAAVVLGALLILLLAGTGIYYYRSTVKMLDGQLWTVFQLEGDRLKVMRGNCAEVPYRNIQLIRRTKRLLMLGYMQQVGRPAWFVMPLRAFESEQEAEAFLGRIRSAQAQPDYAGRTGPMGQSQPELTGRMPNQTGLSDQPAQETDGAQPLEYMRFSFFLDGERWVRLQKGAADLQNGGTFGIAARTYGMLIWSGVMAVGLCVCTFLIAGEFRWSMVCYSLALALWFTLRLYFRSPEKRIRRQLKAPEIAARSCGRWQVSLTEEGVTVCMPMDMKSYFGWDSLQWLVETQEAFYLFYKDKKHYIMIVRESFVSWDQVAAFQRICADHGVHRIAPKKARYVPGWLTWVIFAAIILVSFGILMARIYLDFIGGTFDMQMPVADVPLEEQIETLASLGLYVPEETVAHIQENSTPEYNLQDRMEENPYTWLLMDMGMPSHDENWNVTGYSTEVFWFDFEGFDLTTDYIDLLNGMLALARESPLDSVNNIREDTEDVDWEKGRGRITVSLNWEGKDYSYDMKVFYDWIDDEALTIFNELLEGQDTPKRFYAMGDNGQGAIVFFCTEEWAEEFTEKTGLLLEILE